MNRLVAFIGLIIALSLLVAVPRLAMILWALVFYRDTTFEIYQKVAFSLAWVLGGIALLYAMNRPLQNRFLHAIENAKPKGFVGEFELAGPFRDLYFGISPKTRQILIIDRKKRVTRCEDFKFVQTWRMTETRTQAFLILSFNDLNYSTMTIDIPKARQDEIAAKLNFLL